MRFQLKFTDRDQETNKVFSEYTAPYEMHGWYNKKQFLDYAHRQCKNGKGQRLSNGYEYLRQEIGVITKVEIVR